MVIKILFTIALILFPFIFKPQQIRNEDLQEPFFFTVESHKSNINIFPDKSFYQLRKDWQYIIDTTWGPGLPLHEKQLIFNAYADAIRQSFDGFESLQINSFSWDSLRSYFYSKLDSSTSRGAFSSVMTRFSMALRDLHTIAYDEIMTQTPLNPGIPILVIGGLSYSIEHFGAVLTVLPDSLILVVRTITDHPLNLEPGDIVLGYENIPWKQLVRELLNTGLPIIGRWDGTQSAYDDELLIAAGMNWHLFETIDIIKFNSGDTVSLSVRPLLNLPPVRMINNEQVPIDNIPFPDYFNGEYVSCGVINGTNIGYVYLFEERGGTSDQQFFNAISTLSNTDAMIIDLRLNFGGWSLFDEAFKILFNDSPLTIEDSYRCNPIDFDLCASGNSEVFRIKGQPPNLYDRPIAILLGPNCVSMGDLTAHRFRYHPMVKFFGKNPSGSLGDNLFISNFPDWYLMYSTSDMFHINKPRDYLNRKEFPIDFPVWHNTSDVASGIDAVVSEAILWINNLVFPKNISSSKSFYYPGIDTINIKAEISNPNNHSIGGAVYIYDLNEELIDSLNLSHISHSSLSNWQANWVAPAIEETYKIDVKAIDETTSKSYTLSNASRFTTAGPVVLDSLSIDKISLGYLIKPFVRNLSTSSTISSASIKLNCNSLGILSIYPARRPLPNIPPGAVVGPSNGFIVRVDSTFIDNFNFIVDVCSEDWTYWVDSLAIVLEVKEEFLKPILFSLGQNYPNPFNPTTTINYSLPQKSNVRLAIYDVIGNEVKTLINEVKERGTYTIKFDANKLASGIYLYTIKAGSYIETKKMILLK